MKRGIEAAFEEINSLGGVWGSKKLRLFTLDDAYEPANTKINTDYFLFNMTPPANSLNRALFSNVSIIDTKIRDTVFFGLIGYVGTPTVQAVFPNVTSTGIPLIGSFTGVGWLRTPFYPNVINLRSSYDDETAAMVDWLINVKLIRRISIMYQNDAFGLSGLNGIKRSLIDRLKLPLCSSGTFPRNTLNVESAFYTIGPCNPEAIVMIGTYAPLAKYIKMVKDVAFSNDSTFGYQKANDIIFLTVSFVGSAALTEDLIKFPLPSLQFGSTYYTDNVIITQVVPSPMETSYPIVRAYQRAVTKYSTLQSLSSFTFIELEGYMVGKFVYNVFKHMVGNLTRSNFIASSYFDFSSDYADESKSGGLFIFDGIQMGRYKWCSSLNIYQYYLNGMWSNRTNSCSNSADCNQGLKIVYMSSINMKTGNISFDIYRNFSWYQEGSCISNVNSVLVKPIVIGQSIQKDSIQDELVRIGILIAFQQRNNQTAKNQIVLKTLYHTNAETLMNNTRELTTLNEAVSLVAYSASSLRIESSLNGTNDQTVSMETTEFSNIAMIGVSSINSLALRSRFFKPLIHTFTSILEQLGTVLDYNLKMGRSRFSILYSQSDSTSFEIYQTFETLIVKFGLIIDSACNLDQYYSANISMDSVLNALAGEDSNPQVVIIALRNSTKTIESFISSLQKTYNSKPIFRKGLYIYLMNSLFDNHIETELSLGSIMKGENRFSIHYVSHIPSFHSNQKLFMNEFRTAIQNYNGLNANDRYISLYQKVLEGYFIGRMVTKLVDMNLQSKSSFTALDFLNSIYSKDVLSMSDVTFGKFKEGTCNLGYRENFIYSFNDTSSQFEQLFVKLYDAESCGLLEYQPKARSISSISISEIQQPIIIARLVPFEGDEDLPQNAMLLLSDAENSANSLTTLTNITAMNTQTLVDDEYGKGLEYYFNLFNNKPTTKQPIRFHTEYYSKRQGKNSMEKKVKNMIEKQGVFAFIGTLFSTFSNRFSTLENQARNISQLLSRYNVPMFTLSQDMELRWPYSKYYIHLRPSILDETASLIHYFKNVLSESVLIVYPNRPEWTSQAIPKIVQYGEANELTSVNVLAFDELSTIPISSNAMIIFGNETEIYKIMQLRLSKTATVPTTINVGILSGSFTPTLQQLLYSLNTTAVPYNTIQLHVPTLTSGPKIQDECASSSLESQAMKTFLDAYQLSNPNHQTVEGYLTGYFIETLLGRIYQQKLTSKATTNDLMSTLFSSSIFNLMGLSEVGPFGLECSVVSGTSSSSENFLANSDVSIMSSNTPSSLHSTTILTNASDCNSKTSTVQYGDSCDCNQGPRKILLTRFVLTSLSAIATRRMFNDVQNFEFAFSTCGVKIVYPLFTKGQIAGISIGIGISLICCLSIGVLCSYKCCFRKENAKHAPKSGNITVSFTDIQNSTVLWEQNEKGMRDALKLHNLAIRRALEAYRGYEVKTHGDSFYVAFSDVVDALDWSIAVQHALLEVEWPSSITQMWDCRTEWDEITKQKVWNGLRVRIGLHFGPSEKIYDKTMGRPDYFGTAVNMASRIESSAYGGQVVISEDMFLELWRKLGTFIVKDVKFHTHNFQSYVEEISRLLYTATSDSISDTCSSVSGLNPPKPKFSRQLSTGSNSSNTMTITTATVGGVLRKRYVARPKYVFYDLGEFRLKGLQQKVRLFDVRSDRTMKRSFPILMRNLEKDPSSSDLVQTLQTEEASTPNMDPVPIQNFNNRVVPVVAESSHIGETTINA
ncbi:hypothetical protein C9374_011605 [Naegleria lovaniensis]|uniref:Guanylate cyclase domain-containing protein n=1 Tax=Naegleria lovaniensis TaxID=51637 RepID=A0AA88KCK9_NAELO|nr:uncharacterized protein C9374_011605 [Naegleria lovaniensis]KAG2373940.1 hypothetical protein C9374_011605 [Naegleria lovaniensis]